MSAVVKTEGSQTAMNLVSQFEQQQVPHHHLIPHQVVTESYYYKSSFHIEVMDLAVKTVQIWRDI